jgi:hypothetical protein
MNTEMDIHSWANDAITTIRRFQADYLSGDGGNGYYRQIQMPDVWYDRLKLFRQREQKHTGGSK